MPIRSTELSHTVPAPTLYRTFRSARWCASSPITPAPRPRSMTATMSQAMVRSSPRSGLASTDGESMSTLLTAINTDSSPKPFGHYVQAMDTGGLVFFSGQLPVRLDGTSLADVPFEAQARQSLANLLAIVEGAGLRRDRIAQVTAYLVGVEHWAAFNAIYTAAF